MSLLSNFPPIKSSENFSIQVTNGTSWNMYLALGNNSMGGGNENVVAALGLTTDAVMTMGKLYEKPQNALNTQESSSRQPH